MVKKNVVHDWKCTVLHNIFSSFCHPESSTILFCKVSIIIIFQPNNVERGNYVKCGNSVERGKYVFQSNMGWGIHSTSSQIKVTANQYCHDLNFALYFVSRGVAVFVSLTVSYQQTSSRSFALMKGYCSTVHVTVTILTITAYFILLNQSLSQAVYQVQW